MSEFESFIGRKREQIFLRINNLGKVILAATVAHFIVIRVPKMFDSYFNDDIKSEMKGELK